MANTNNNNSPEMPKIQDQEKNMELGFPPYYNSIFPVFPIEMDLGDPSSMNLLDPFHVEMGVIEETVEAESRSEDRPAEEQRFQMQRWGLAITKAARSKRKIVRQMSLGQRTCIHQQQRRSAATLNSLTSALSTKGRKKQGVSAAFLAAEELIPHPMPDNNGLRLVLQKELRNSDVSSLGRIILPKRDAELNLPYLTAKEGIHILVRDLISSQLWSMRYRYWPNNKSKMYVLENTGEFVKEHGLTIGDFVVLYKDERNLLVANLTDIFNDNEYIGGRIPSFYNEEQFISATKVERQPTETNEGEKKKSVEENTKMEEAMDSHAEESSRESHCSLHIITHQSISTQLALTVSKPKPETAKALADEGDVRGAVHASAVNLQDCVFSHLERLPGFEDSDLSLYDDDLMEKSTGSEEKRVVVT